MKIGSKGLLCLLLALLILPAPKVYAAKADSCICDFIWPLKGKNTYITSYFGGRIHPITGKKQNHSGIDIAAPKGTPVYAAEEGTLKVAYDKCTHNYGKNSEQMKKCGCGNNYGNHVYIVHPDGKNTLYAHLTSIDVQDGKYVYQGQQIGTVGSTGRSTGFHLHFEVRLDETGASRADPLDYVSVPSFITLGEGNYYPDIITKGEGYYLSGKISSIYAITSVTVKVLNTDGSATSQKKTYSPGGTSCNISELDSYIHFGRLDAGEYILNISASDGSGAHSELVNHRFSVASKLKNGIIDSFAKNQNDLDNSFNDVKSADWYSGNVDLVYELGLMNGVDKDRFDPNGSVTYAQAVTLASRMHSIYYGKSIRPAKGNEMWYKPYVEYAQKNGLMMFEVSDFNGFISREQFAALLCNAVSSGDLYSKNIVTDNGIPDVKIDDEYAREIYRLYRAGVLTGSDTEGRFYPYSHISRAEAAAIVTRIVCPDMRQNITLG